MRSITVYHGSSQPDVVPNHEKILYVTPDTRYNYIQHSEYTYRASFKSQTPYLTDNQSFVEALRSNPERIQVLRDMGYDAVLYSSPNDLSSGASGWGNDMAQYVVLNPDILSDWTLSEKPLPDKPGKTASFCVGPVFHATTNHFVSFDDTDEIGHHFGSLRAARDRISQTKRVANIRAETISPGQLDNDRLMYEEGKGKDGPAGYVMGILLKKLSNPKPGIYSELLKLPESELQEIAIEYSAKDDVPDYQASLKRARKGEYIAVYSDNDLIAEVPSMRYASALKQNLLSAMTKESYLAIENPLHLPDLGVWSPAMIMRQVPGGNAHMERMYGADSEAGMFEVVRDAIEQAGFDGISYTNEVEDKGSLSYIPLRKEQIITIGPKLSLPDAPAPSVSMDSHATKIKRRI